jgi:hypothetical protein
MVSLHEGLLGGGVVFYTKAWQKGGDLSKVVKLLLSTIAYVYGDPGKS